MKTEILEEELIRLLLLIGRTIRWRVLDFEEDGSGTPRLVAEPNSIRVLRGADPCISNTIRFPEPVCDQITEFLQSLEYSWKSAANRQFEMKDRQIQAAVREARILRRRFAAAKVDYAVVERKLEDERDEHKEYIEKMCDDCTRKSCEEVHAEWEEKVEDALAEADARIKEFCEYKCLHSLNGNANPQIIGGTCWRCPLGDLRREWLVELYPRYYGIAGKR